jgi:cyclohexa-1,5-dienecarbonyl-CoA hydratase
VGNLSVDRDDARGVTRITLNKPPLNVLDIALIRELTAALSAVRGDAGCKLLVLGATGKLFCAGVDIQDHTADRVEQMICDFHALIRAVWSLEQPTVAAVQGSALGGGMELALACDFIVASDHAKFGQPEIQVGVFPPIAALALPRLIPQKKALELVLTGRSMNAGEAERWGLVNVVAPAEDFERAVDEFIEPLVKLSGVVLRLTKRATRLGLDGENDGALNQIEQLYLNELMTTADAREGLTAFLEKRAPVWKNE